MATADAVIAATALAHGASLATRDGPDFADLRPALIHPWTFLLYPTYPAHEQESVRRRGSE